MLQLEAGPRMEPPVQEPMEPKMRLAATGSAGAAGGAAGGVVQVPGVMDFTVDFVMIAACKLQAAVLSHEDAAGGIQVHNGGAVGVGARNP